MMRTTKGLIAFDVSWREGITKDEICEIERRLSLDFSIFMQKFTDKQNKGVVVMRHEPLPQIVDLDVPEETIEKIPFI